MSNIQTVPIESIDHNPFRSTEKYPFVTRKIEALKRSISAVGLWEGIIARQQGNRFELAFGHHRFEASRLLGLTEIPIIVRDLTDEQMLGYMGRENMEDFNADFLTMLETWEAAWNWQSPSRDGEVSYPVDTAILLGWTQARTDSDRPQMNRTADACNAAHSLLRDGHLKREDLADLTVHEAREICTRAAANIVRIEKSGKAFGASASDIAAAKATVAKAVKTTAKESRAGEVAKKDLRGRVDLNAYRHAHSSKSKDMPLFDIFGKMLANGIEKMLKSDVTAEKLGEVIKALPNVRDNADVAIVRRLKFELTELSDRALKFDRWLNLGKTQTILKAVPAIEGEAS